MREELARETGDVASDKGEDLMTGRLSTRHISYSFQRIWEETRARLLPDTDAVAPRYGRIWGQKRMHTDPRSP